MKKTGEINHYYVVSAKNAIPAYTSRDEAQRFIDDNKLTNAEIFLLISEKAEVIKARKIINLDVHEKDFDYIAERLGSNQVIIPEQTIPPDAYDIEIYFKVKT